MDPKIPMPPVMARVIISVTPDAAAVNIAEVSMIASLNDGLGTIPRCYCQIMDFNRQHTRCKPSDEIQTSKPTPKVDP